MLHALLRGGLAAALVLLAAPSLSAQGTWQLLDTNTTVDLNAVSFVGSDVGYAVGASGTVLKTTDGGVLWTDVSPGGPDLFGVHFFDASTGVVVGAGGAIRRTADGGATWTPVPSGTSDPIYSVAFADNVGLAGAGSQTILRSPDQGATWTVVQGGFFGGGFFGADMVDDANGVVAGQNSIFAPLVGITDDGGATFDFSTFLLNSNEGSLRDVDFLDPLNGFAAGRTFDFRGAISASGDGGQTWTTTLFDDPLYGIDFVSDETGLAVGGNGAILKTSDGGATWVPETSGTPATLNGVSFPSPATAYAVGDGGTVVKGTFGSGVPLTLVLTPSDPPVEVFPGESFTFAVEVSNTGGQAATFDLWAEGMQTGGGLSATRGPRTFTLPGGASRRVTLTQRVPLVAPAGAYTFAVNAGDFPGDVFASDSFPVTVLSPAEHAEASTGPVGFALAPNAPNPFGPQTSIGYSLPAGAHVTLRVYDALGQEVARLVNGYREAGHHEVAFDAADLPAGLYLYRLEAGSFRASRSMLRAE